MPSNAPSSPSAGGRAESGTASARVMTDTACRHEARRASPLDEPRKRYWSRRDCPTISGCVEWRMTPSASVTRDRADAGESGARRGEAWRPLRSGAAGAADRAAVQGQLAQRRVAGGERPAQVFGQDGGEVGGARLGRSERLIARVGQVIDRSNANTTSAPAVSAAMDVLDDSAPFPRLTVSPIEIRRTAAGCGGGMRSRSRRRRRDRAAGWRPRSRRPLRAAAARRARWSRRRAAPAPPLNRPKPDCSARSGTGAPRRAPVSRAHSRSPVSSAVASPSFSHAGTPREASVRISACVNSCESTRSSSSRLSSAPRIGTRMMPSYAPAAHDGDRVMSRNCSPV